MTLCRILLPLLLVATVATVDRVAAEPFGADGLFLRVDGIQRTIHGDFDGTTVLTDSSPQADGTVSWSGETFTVPKLDPGWGLAVEAGLRNLPWSFGIGATRTTHDGFWESYEQDARAKSAFGEARYALFDHLRIHPEIELAVDFTRIDVDAGAQSDSDLGTATYKGLGVRAGGGLVAHVTPAVFAVADVTYRWTRYDRISGVFDADRQLVTALGGGGWEVHVGIQLVVWPILWVGSAP
jgi:hypothetical protein